jgi:phosphoesterase RecJ-like protein
MGRIPVLINLDHHVTNDHFGHFNLVDASACATAEIVYRLVIGMGVAPNRAIANAIYTGILTDTGSFRFSNTNKEAFAICREMVEYGVDPPTVAQHVYGTYSMGRIKLLNLALDSIEISTNGKLSVMTLSKEMFEETQTKPEDVDGFIHYAQRIQDVKVAALIQERPAVAGQSGEATQFHVSLRSDGEIDVAAIASTFGGGGHSSAAGFNINTSLFDLKSRIIALAEQF